VSVTVPQAPPASGSNIVMPITDTTHPANTNMLNFDDTGAGSSTLDNSGDLGLTPGVISFSNDINLSRLQPGLIRMTSTFSGGGVLQIYNTSTGQCSLYLFRTAAGDETIRFNADQAGNQYTIDRVSTSAGAARPLLMRRSIDNGGTFINDLTISNIGNVSVGGSVTAAGTILTNNGQTQIQGANSTPPAGTMSLLFGSGVPNAGNGNNGDYYLRQDGVAGSRIYHKETGAWVASSA